MQTTLENEFRIIDANHAELTSVRDERDLLRILLRHTESGRMSFLDGCCVQQILAKHPKFADVYGLTIKRKL